MGHKLGFLVGVASDTGQKRKNNEDSWLIYKTERSPANKAGHNLFAVADGIGGSAAGEVASKMAVERLAEHYFSFPEVNPPEALRLAIQDAHEKINERARKVPECTGMGSTLTALVLVGGEAYLAQIGDSRAYLIRDNQIMQLTIDQTVTADLVAKGKITLAEAQTHSQRHVLIQSMGGGRRLPEPDLMAYTVRQGDILILCTDGLYNLVSDNEIKDMVKHTNPQSAVEQLVQLANERGGTDNITVIAIKIIGCDFLSRLLQSFQRAFTNARVMKR